MAETIEKRIETSPELRHAVNEAVPTPDGSRRAPTKFEKAKRTEELDRRSHKKKTQAAGVGPSKVFAAEPGVFDETRDWSKLTVNGQPIPEHLWARLPYCMTDQGVIEANAGREPRRAEVLREAPLASYPADVLTALKQEESIEQSVARYRESIELMEQEDPLGVLMKLHTPEGRRGRWMSDRTSATIGLRRAGMDYEPLLVDGKRIQHGGMFLATVPEALAIAAEQHMAKKSVDLTKSAIATVQHQVDQVMGEAGLKRQRERGDLPEGGIEFLENDQGGMLPGEFGHQFKG
jgi:hypothetical protein